MTPPKQKAMNAIKLTASLFLKRTESLTNISTPQPTKGIINKIIFTNKD